jgi:hypothetical protein
LFCEDEKLCVNAGNEKRVGDSEVFPFGLAPPFAREFTGRVAALNEDLRSFGADNIEPFVRAGLYAAEIARIPQHWHATF